MADFIFKISPNIVLGSYTTTRLGQFALEYGKKYIVILDPILKEFGTSQKIIQSLQDRNVDFFTFDEIPIAADTETIETALSLARQAHIHGIIASGGGKTINVAKAVATLYNEDRNIYDFADDVNPTAEPLPLIILPTTTRDPFIFTDKTPMIDARSSKIKLLKNANNLCRLSIWDPTLTSSLTDKQLSAMGIETLCLAVETYLSPKATFFSDMLIEKAVQLISYSMEPTQTLNVTTPKELLLTQGGCMTSLGVATASMGAASLLAQTINARYKLSRSLTSTILFPYIIEDGAKYKSDKIATLAKILNAAPKDADNDSAAASFAEYIRRLIAKMNIPARLKELSLSIEQLSLAAEDAGELEFVNSLQRSMTSDDLFELIKQAY